VGAASVDRALADAIATRFASWSDVLHHRIFYSREAPLKSLSGKADIAHALGLIDDEDFSEITVIRHVRNAFAYAAAALSFTEPAISEKCMSLPNGLRKTLRLVLGEDDPAAVDAVIATMQPLDQQPGPRDRFVSSVLGSRFRLVERFGVRG
jgi:DNA-binding MltR family transcriptional regulator